MKRSEEYAEAAKVVGESGLKLTNSASIHSTQLAMVVGYHIASELAALRELLEERLPRPGTRDASDRWIPEFRKMLDAALEEKLAAFRNQIR